MRNNMLNKLKSGYEELETNPSADLWDILNQKLDERQQVEDKPGASFQWLKYAAVILLLISIATLSYFNYKTDSDLKNTDIIVKKGWEKTRRPVHPESGNLPVIANEGMIPGKEVTAFTENRRSDAHKKTAQKILQTGNSEFKIQQIAIKQPEPVQMRPLEIENTMPVSPVVAGVEKTKSTYISANELLLGREFDKATKNSGTDAIKFGVFNFDKPKIENITVLGVTVYTDTK